MSWATERLVTPDTKFTLGQLITNGSLAGKVVCLVKHSITYDTSAVWVETKPAINGQPPEDVLVPDSDPNWHLASSS